LSQDTEVTGNVRVELFAKSSVADTDFTAKLVDVAPNGFAHNLAEGIVRARYRNSQDKPELMKPGELYQFKIDLWNTSNVFRKGHRIRLEISSSNFPRFDRNFNGVEERNGEAKPIASNAVLHDSQHPSALVLPIVSRP